MLGKRVMDAEEWAADSSVHGCVNVPCGKPDRSDHPCVKCVRKFIVGRQLYTVYECRTYSLTSCDPSKKCERVNHYFPILKQSLTTSCRCAK